MVKHTWVYRVQETHKRVLQQHLNGMKLMKRKMSLIPVPLERPLPTQPKDIPPISSISTLSKEILKPEFITLPMFTINLVNAVFPKVLLNGNFHYDFMQDAVKTLHCFLITFLDTFQSYPRKSGIVNLSYYQPDNFILLEVSNGYVTVSLRGVLPKHRKCWPINPFKVNYATGEVAMSNFQQVYYWCEKGEELNDDPEPWTFEIQTPKLRFSKDLSPKTLSQLDKKPLTTEVIYRYACARLLFIRGLRNNV